MNVDPHTHNVEYNANKFQVADIQCVIECEMDKMEAVRQITADTQRLRVSVLLQYHF